MKRSAEPFTRVRGRALFLGAVARIEPDVLGSLKRGPYNVWVERAKGRKQKADLDESLRVWSHRWELTDPWCEKWARDTLEWWDSQDDEKFSQWCPESYFSNLNIFGRESFSFCYEHWSPSDERWTTYAARAKKEFNRALTTHRQDVELIMGEAPTTLHSTEHFEWLALYQIKNLRYTDIWRFAAKRQRIRNPSSVEKACKRLADKIGLTPRKRST